MNPWASTVPPRQGCVSLTDLSGLVAARNGASVTRQPLRLVKAGLARRGRPHIWARKLNAGAGSRTRHLGREFDAA